MPTKTDLEEAKNKIAEIKAKIKRLEEEREMKETTEKRKEGM